MASQPFEQYTCLHTISLFDKVDPIAFEQAMADDIMANVRVSRRSIRGASLEHRLLKALGGQGAGQYMWQTRASNLDMVGQQPDYKFLVGAIEEDVRQALTPWGTVDSVTAFQEIGGVAIP